MHEDLISIIVPVYNTSQYLDRSINSMLAQTYKNLEIILVDNASEDDSGEICERYAKMDSRIVVLHLPHNIRPSGAREAGFKVSTGELIGFMDSDDELKADMYESLYRAMQEIKADIVQCGVRVVLENGKGFNSTSSNSLFTTQEAIRELLIKRYIDYTVWSKLFRRAVFDGVIIHYDDLKRFEDLYLVIQCLMNAKRVYTFSDPKYYYYMRGTSLSHNVLDADVLQMTQAVNACVVEPVRVYPELRECAEYCKWLANFRLYQIISGDEEFRRSHREECNQVLKGVRRENTRNLIKYMKRRERIIYHLLAFPPAYMAIRKVYWLFKH